MEFFPLIADQRSTAEDGRHTAHEHFPQAGALPSPESNTSLVQVLKVVRKTLQDLHLAIEGTIIMSTSLKDMLDAMYDARVPERLFLPPYCCQVSWESSTLGFWFTELMERDSQFRRWYSYGRPKAFWITGFFNPQGFPHTHRK